MNASLRIDLFAGMGGWDVGAVLADIPEFIGFEHNEIACRTRAAAGFTTIRADVSNFRIPDEMDYLIGSPPCQAFSRSGKREGVKDITAIFDSVRRIARDDVNFVPDVSDPRAALVVEPLRWICWANPQRVLLEQVPEVLPLWEAYGYELEELGYSVVTGILNCADYGVPQTRERAFLMAAWEFAPSFPEPTHARVASHGIFGSREKWVSISEALGWEGDHTDDPARTVAGHRQPRWLYRDPDGSHGRVTLGFRRKDDGRGSSDGYRTRDIRDAEEPAFTLTEKARSWEWHLNTGKDWEKGGTREDAQKISVTDPAPTVSGAKGSASIWKLCPTNVRPHSTLRGPEEPAATLAFGHETPRWVEERPATTLSCDARMWPPGHKVNAEDRERLGEEEANARYGDRAGSEAIRLKIEEALILQSFPWDFPVQGTKTAKFLQVGNAVPPLMAAHLFMAMEPS